jgi:hypothetical protein
MKRRKFLKGAALGLVGLVVGKGVSPEPNPVTPILSTKDNTSIVEVDWSNEGRTIKLPETTWRKIYSDHINETNIILEELPFVRS